MLKKKVPLNKFDVEYFLKKEFKLEPGKGTNNYANGGGIHWEETIIFPERRKDVCAVHYIEGGWPGRGNEPLMSDGHWKTERIFVVWSSNDSILRYKEIGIKYSNVCLIYHYIGLIKINRNKISIEIKQMDFPDPKSEPSSVKWAEVNI